MSRRPEGERGAIADPLRRRGRNPHRKRVESPTVRAAELDQIHIDISVLSPLQRSDNPLTLEIGKHGLHVERDQKRGVLLPQVAVEYGWDMATFLEQTCVKADLPKEAWRWRDTAVCAFTALIIEEEK